MSIKRVPETEAFIDTLEEKDIYRFMRSEYDRITNDGDNYDVDVHDAQVAQIASEKFNITPKEAGDLYAAVEFKIADFHQKRLSK